MYRSPLSLAVCLAAVLAAVSPAPAARATAEDDVPRVSPSWTREFDSPVRWHRVTPLGHLVVATTSSLHGVDAENGETLWAHAGMGDLAGERYAEIPGTALVLLAAEGRDGRAVVLDSIAGRVAFDSSRHGIATVLAAHVLPRSGGLLVMGPEVGEPRTKLLLFDLETGEKRWENDDLLGGMGKLASALATLVQANTGDSGITGEPREIGAEAFLIATRMGVYAIDIRTGKTLWDVLDVATGSMRFKSPLKAKGRMLETEILEQGVLYRTTHEINVFDPATGKPLAKKSIVSDEPLVTANHGDVLYAYAHVDKATGRMSELIDLRKDHEPAYQVDAIDNRVFYQPEARALVGYRMQAAPAGSASGTTSARTAPEGDPDAGAEPTSGLEDAPEAP